MIMGDDGMDKITEMITLDSEWIILMEEAKMQGITVEEVRLFLTGAEEGAN
jgi:hypothetical protein